MVLCSERLVMMISNIMDGKHVLLQYSMSANTLRVRETSFLLSIMRVQWAPINCPWHITPKLVCSNSIRLVSKLAKNACIFPIDSIQRLFYCNMICTIFSAKKQEYLFSYSMFYFCYFLLGSKYLTRSPVSFPIISIVNWQSRKFNTCQKTPEYFNWNFVKLHPRCCCQTWV